MIAAVDMFCGIGGLTHGLILEDINVVAGFDIDEECRYAYEVNNPGAKFIGQKIEDTSPEEILKLYPKNSTKILVGCAPCQPFSSFTNSQRNKRDQWKLVEVFAELIVQVQPDVVSMENVIRLRAFQDGAIFERFVDILEPDYEVTPYEVYCPDYGIPQNRKRLVVFASKRGRVDLIEKTHSPANYETVESTIYDQPRIAAGEVDANDPLHRAQNLSPENLERIRQSKPGGTWEDWDPELILACHRRESGRRSKSVYGRMAWDKPSPTITTQAFTYGTGRFGHPELDRALSLREMALLQTFPRGYKFVNPEYQEYHFTKIGRWIGNAVPVDLGRVIARSIVKHLEK